MLGYVKLLKNSNNNFNYFSSWFNQYNQRICHLKIFILWIITKIIIDKMLLKFMPSHQPDIRMDFVTKKVECVDKEKGIYRFCFEPHPDRYEKGELSGKKGYFDKFDRTFYPEEILEKAANSLIGQNMHYSPPKIKNSHNYAISRIDSIKKFLDGENEEEAESINSNDFLEDMDNLEMRFVILSIDIKGSTKMSQDLSPEMNYNVINLFLKEMALVINKFNGNVLKYTGDGLLAYFTEPNFIGMNDNALDCACAMRKVVFHAINPVLRSKELPKLSFRIGLDSGKATVKKFGIPEIKTQRDLIGDTVNIAVKIQDLANDSQILVGQTTVINSHVYWREKIKKIKLPNNWNYIDKLTGNKYKIYQLKE